MDRRRFLDVAAIAVFALGLIAGSAIAQQEKAREQGAATGAVEMLAPAGKLRVGVYSGSPYSMIRAPGSGEVKGMAVEIGKALALRLGVPYAQVEFGRPAEIYAALRSGEVDVTLVNATPARADDFAWSPPLLLIELGFLVPAGSPIRASVDVDREGVRVGVTQGGTMNGELANELKNATVVTAASLKNGIEMLAANQIDVYATNKANLFEMSDALPGSRVLEERWGLEHLALAIPKERAAGLVYLRAFTAEMKSSGFIAAAAARVKLRGVAAE